jgi:hypothetical protein
MEASDVDLTRRVEALEVVLGELLTMLSLTTTHQEAIEYLRSADPDVATIMNKARRASQQRRVNEDRL